MTLRSKAIFCMTTPDYRSPEFIAQQRQKLMQFAAEFPFFKLLGMQIIDVAPGRARLSVAHREDLCQPAGILHGGVIASLVDTSIAHAILLTPEHLEARPRGGRLVSLDLRIKYLRPVSEGIVYCDAQVTRMGRQIIHTAASVTNAAGKEIASGDSIYMMVSVDRLQRAEGA
jgi:uncharacterized protein (TIGR00369 family)